jgi:hypothetical protein
LQLQQKLGALKQKLDKKEKEIKQKSEALVQEQ